MSEREAQAIADAVMRRVLDEFNGVTTSVRQFDVDVGNVRAKAQQELARLRDSIIKDVIARLRLGKSPEAIVEELTQAYAREAPRGPIMDVAMALAQSLIRRRVTKELVMYILTLFTEMVRGRLGIGLSPPQAPTPVKATREARREAVTVIYGRMTPFETPSGCTAVGPGSLSTG